MNREEQLIMKVRDAIASGTTGSMSKGEALAVALVLNRADWLTNMGYTIAEALGRVDDDWIQAIPKIARLVAVSTEAISKAQITSAQESTLSQITEVGTEVDVTAKLVTYGNAPGYRSVSFTLDLTRLGGLNSHRVRMNLDSDDSLSILRHVLEVHRFAWTHGDPIDKKDGEKRPLWIDRTSLNMTTTTKSQLLILIEAYATKKALHSILEATRVATARKERGPTNSETRALKEMNMNREILKYAVEDLPIE